MDLWEAFSELPDPRTGPAQRHDLREMIVMALGAVLCGCNTWVEMANWAEVGIPVHRDRRFRSIVTDDSGRT